MSAGTEAAGPLQTFRETSASARLVLLGVFVNQFGAFLQMFLVLYLVQAGMFFTIPLFLSVSLGLSALETGVRILPLSITLLAAAVGIPRFFPRASPRRVVRLGLLAMFAGVVVLMSAISKGASDNGKSPSTPQPFDLCTAGMYDNSLLEGLDFESYKRFCLDLFECRQERFKIGGITFAGRRKGEPVQLQR